jgi:hypothetical protein
MKPAGHEVGYDQGYTDGEASAHEHWAQALADVLPVDVEATPGQVAAYIERLQRG